MQCSRLSRVKGWCTCLGSSAGRKNAPKEEGLGRISVWTSEGHVARRPGSKAPVMPLKPGNASLTMLHENCFPTEARNVTHTHKITHALLTSVLLELFVCRTTVLGNKAYETSASQNYTLLGYMPEICWGSHVGQEHTPKPRKLQKNVVWNRISNTFVTAHSCISVVQTIHDPKTQTSMN